jgi:hypothetical protein
MIFQGHSSGACDVILSRFMAWFVLAVFQAKVFRNQNPQTTCEVIIFQVHGSVSESPSLKDGKEVHQEANSKM